MARPLKATLSRSALRHNLAQVKRFAPQSKVIAMVKADGYGHGIIEVAQTLVAADAFGVACIEEALALRESGITNEIILMEGFFEESEIPLISEHGLTTVIHSEYQIRMLKRAAKPKPIRAWMKFNSGMNRLGLPLSDGLKRLQEVSELKNIELVGVMGHFAQADEPHNSITLEQYERFKAALHDFKGCWSFANSATLLHWQGCHADWVRPGLMLYGASPVANQTGADYGLKPVMELSTQLIAIQELKPGERVGYGGVWECKDEPCVIGIAAVGYGDGYPWHAPSGTHVLVGQHQAALAGRVSMDMIGIDISRLSAKVGDKVTLWGPDLPVEHIALQAKTICYELFCRLTDRVKISWID